jgi:hypothetical protein
MLRSLAILAALALVLPSCGRGPPRALSGFSLGMPQDEVLERARKLGGFTCSIRGTRPPVTICEGPTADGEVLVTVRDDEVVRVGLRRVPEGRRPQRDMRRFVSRYGDPAWRERPYPSRFEPLEGYHTLWLNRDSTRWVAAICHGQRLEPPCSIDLAVTSPAGVRLLLDGLLGIGE